MVKSKYKTSSNDKIRNWWFVIKGDKLDVELLDKQWTKVIMHTGWKLEPLLRFDFDDDSTENATVSTPIHQHKLPYIPYLRY